jgi:hypothetical protein
MTFFRRRAHEPEPRLEPALRPLEEALRRYRPPAPRALIVAIAGTPPAEPGPSPARSRRPQLVVGVALTVLVFASLAAVGGVSYAANAVTHAARSVLVTRTTLVGKGLTAGGDQYRPGYGFGDPNHEHTGPPGVENGKPGEKAPPSQVKSTSDTKAFLVSAQITVDEQAALYFSVLDSNGNQLLLTQRGSRIGSKVEGPQVKTIHYVMLVPRTVALQLRVPANLLQHGQTYTLRVIAVDAQGNKTRTLIPFTA